MNYIGNQYVYVDKVTYQKKYDGRNLGKCVGEGFHSVNKLPIIWFDEPFLGFTWQYTSNVKEIKK